MTKDYDKQTGYSSQTICLDVKATPITYIERLLHEKLTLLNKYSHGNIVTDVCCGNGNYLKALSGFTTGIGIDFCFDFIRDRSGGHFHFVCADGRRIPLNDNTSSLTYSLSALYALRNPEEVIREMVRITKPGGYVVLDLVNSRSLNGIASMHMDAYRPRGLMTLTQMKKVIRDQNLKTIEHHRFQILPYSANKPRYLMPILLPFWGRLMRRRIKGKMLDQWISQLPCLRLVAGRHLFVCQKQG